MVQNTTRRTFLKSIGATAATAGVAGTASAQEYRTSTRFAVFNIEELTTGQVQETESSFSADDSTDEQAEAAARVIQEIRPDVIALKELTNNIQQGKATDKTNVRAFIDNYLREPQADHLDPIAYPYTLQPKSNTGVLPEDEGETNYDFNKDGEAGSRPGDAFGFGLYPGHYAFAIASQYPIIESEIRTFRKFRWKDMPGNLMPVDDGSETLSKEDGDLWLTPEEAQIYRLSSKTHIDVPIRMDGEVVHGLVSHPTPAAFDGANNFNERWNHDENRFWADYVASADYIYDDDGNEGGLEDGAPYVLMGDMNTGFGGPADTFFIENDDFYTEELPTSAGGNAVGNQYATAEFGGGSLVDYVLPSPHLTYEGGAVVWPTADDEGSGLAEAAETASDHRMVWADANLERPGLIRSLVDRL
ncbi:endonuclease/exonuclease/phosphatase family protein [Halorhabdus salina]|uniref:endonuclease/exonuclease/phosphatase family protein n=1 Tax=Halorhabdus salina TaxID=2750670 RepID=UPI0015EFB919|nr:endonuclease/exonuclease/phosphatase family protein [Halorhabdus salina]